MNMNALPQERRKVLATARRYRRDGYKVTGPDEWPEKPDFLGDIVPALIAEREDDKVIVEVKEVTAIRGSNEIVELAKRVASQPGWRFELIGLPAPSKVGMPDLDSARAEVKRLLEQGFSKPAFILVCATIENLAAYASVLSRRRPEKQPVRSLIREMVLQGFISEDVKHEIDEALARRNAILHDASEPTPTRRDIEALLNLGDEIRRELLEPGEE